MMQPIKITARMQDGRVATVDPWLPLDGILAGVWVKRNYPELAYLTVTDTKDLIMAELPFERRGSGELWYWACSFNTVAPLHEYIMHWHKRQDDNWEKYIDFKGKRGKIDNKSGKFKAYRMPLVVQLFDRLEWYAVGDPDAVLDLCRDVTHIGKKSSQGLGAVDHWEVESWPEDWSVMKGCNVTRAIPAEILPEGAMGRAALQAVRPPYWLSDNQRVCVMPEVGA